jgi:hypothetical protein
MVFSLCTPDPVGLHSHHRAVHPATDGTVHACIVDLFSDGVDLVVNESLLVHGVCFS